MTNDKWQITGHRAQSAERRAQNLEHRGLMANQMRMRRQFKSSCGNSGGVLVVVLEEVVYYLIDHTGGEAFALEESGKAAFEYEALQAGV